MQKMLQENPRVGSGPRWATIERSPEIGAFKKKVKNVGDHIKLLGEDWDIDAASGTIYHKRITVAR